MPEARDINYATHRKYVKPYHVVGLALMLLYLLWALYQVIFRFSLHNLGDLVLGIVVLLALAYARIFPLQVQDRLIYLEQDQRLRRLLPEELHPRLGEINKRHRVALRFAADDEIPALVERILAGELKTDDAIKRAIKVWVPDPLRV
jgi:hypothetical protein